MLRLCWGGVHAVAAPDSAAPKMVCSVETSSWDEIAGQQQASSAESVLKRLHALGENWHRDKAMLQSWAHSWKSGSHSANINCCCCMHTTHTHTVVWCAIGCVILNTYTSVTYLHHLWISKFCLWYKSCESILIEKQHFSLKKIKFLKYVRDLFLWNLISKFFYHCVLLVSWGLAIICRCF